jgi:hypothetical protein
MVEGVCFKDGGFSEKLKILASSPCAKYVKMI